ncbi:MAG: hypothetical protein IT184_11690 [Acidobacteria bacterium]|nr:hypothetical protein [Acidobacteriota bacterium]
MADDLPQSVLIERALAVARVRAVRDALLALHKTLIDAERQRYERANGRIEGAQAALRLVLEDLWFRWLSPLATAIVQIDERLADESAPLDAAQGDTYLERVRHLLHDADGPFVAEYHRALQETPDVVVAHARVMSLLNGPPGR